jgi:HEAT repeats
VSETQVQIADEPGGEPPSPEAAPYKNLWVPLIVIPAGIVMAIVLVVALFGNLAGEERSPAENLELVATGGKNERSQALMALTIQQNENMRAASQGGEPPWVLGPGFEARVLEVLGDLDADDYGTRITLANLLAGLGNPAAVGALVPLLGLTDGDDPEFQRRFRALQGLGLLGDPKATGSVLPLLDHSEPQLRAAAAAALANLAGDGVRGALTGALADSSLIVSGTAAFSLAKLDPPGFEAARVLVEMTAMDPYERAREADPKLFTRGEVISRNRIKALAFLALLDRDEDWAHIESMREDPDLNVREQVLALLAKHGEKP